MIRHGDFVLRNGNDVFVPAGWARHKEIIAYSRDGHADRTWTLPANWRHVRHIDIRRIGQEGLTPVAQHQPVTGGAVTLSLPPGAAFSIQPS
jgi:hypothetical protein